MNIGVVVDNAFFNDERVKREVDILKKQFGEVYVLCFDFGESLSSADKDISIVQIKISRKRKDLLFFFQNCFPLYNSFWSKNIAEFINKKNIDVIHAHDLYMARASALGIKKSARQCKLILDLHENYPEVVKSYAWTKGFVRKHISRPELWLKKEHKYLGFADKIIVLSEDFKDLLTKRYTDLNANDFIVFPNVPDLSVLNSYSSDQKFVDFKYEKPVFFYFGVIGRRRGIFQTIEVFNQYLNKGNKGSLLLIGPVDKYDKELFFKAINDNKNIIYKPWIPIEQLPAFLELSDICLAPFEKNPQHESGVSNKIYQYMYGKKPIISSNCKPQQDLIEKFNFGEIFSNNEEYLNAMIVLANDKKKRELMGDNAYNALINEFKLDNFKDRLLNLYSAFEKNINTSKSAN